MGKLAINANGSDVCSYLGSQEDPETALWYPSLNNRCYRSQPAASIKLDYQRTRCLTTSYSECTVCQRGDGLPPTQDIGEYRRRSLNNISSRVHLWMILGVIVIIGLLIWQSLSVGLFRFKGWGNSPGGAKPIALTENGRLIPSIVPTLVQRTSTATMVPFSPSPTWTVATFMPTRNVFHALETPIGITTQFVIHRVQLGESLTLLSTQFGTTVGAIQQVNFNIKFPLLVDSLIIIPINQTDVSGLPSFEAYMVEKDMPAEELAKQLSVNPSLFEVYNDIKANQVLKNGEWVLVPRSPVTTK